MKRDVLGLRIVDQDRPLSPQMQRVREQLRAADALITIERDSAEPENVRRARREGEDLLGQARYEEAEEAFLQAIETGLADDHFCWQAAVNLVNCHRFLGRLAEAEVTAAELLDMYAEQGDHAIHYLLSTQRGAICADRFTETGQPAAAEEALAWALRAYGWQTAHRGQADGLRAYNLVVAHLRLGHEGEARAVYRGHEHDDDFRNWCRQGDQAAAIARLVQA